MKVWCVLLVALAALMAVYLGPTVQTQSLQPQAVLSAAELFGETPYETMGGYAMCDVVGTCRIVDGVLLFDSEELEDEGWAIPVVFDSRARLVKCDTKLMVANEDVDGATTLMTLDSQQACDLNVEELGEDLARMVDAAQVVHAVDVSGSILFTYDESDGWLRIDVCGDGIDFTVELRPTAERIPVDEEVTSCHCSYRGVCDATIQCPKGYHPYCSCKKTGCTAMCKKLKPARMEVAEGESESLDADPPPTMQPQV